MNDFDTGKKYPALSAIVVVIKIVAVLVGILGVAAAFVAMRGGYSVAPAIGVMIGVVVAFVIMWAAAESIAVIIDIEANTRASALAARTVRQEPTLERIEPDLHDRLPPLGTR